MPDPHLRAGDADRAAVAAALGEHMAAGRLTLAEYDERVARAYAAKTYGELAELTTDLPALPGRRNGSPPAQAHPVPAKGPAQVPAGRNPRHHGSVADAWRAWFATSLVVTTIWLLTSLGSGEFSNFWPIWVIGPWGAVLLASSITGGGRRGGDGPRRRLDSR
jgi:Domain of unknown function (DUF1707)